MEGTVFPPRRNFRSILVPLLVLPLFIAGCVVAATQYGRPGWVAAGFFSFILLLLVAQAAGWWCVYRVDGSGVFAKRWHKKRLFTLEEIEGIAVLTNDEAQARLQPVLDQGAQGTRGRDFGMQMSSRREVARYTTYCSVPIAYTEKRRGGTLGVVAVGSIAHGVFAEIVLSRGERYLLSPADTPGFVESVHESLRSR